MDKMLRSLSLKMSLILLLVCSGQTAFSQLVKVSGIAIDTLKNMHLNPFRVSLNDTLQKSIVEGHAKFAYLKGLKPLSAAGLEELSKTLQENSDRTLAIATDTNLVVIPQANGQFSIMAKLTDTLYFSSAKFITQKYAVADLVKQTKIFIQLKPKPCVTYNPCKENSTRLYAFVGEKISVTAFTPNYCGDVLFMDSRFECAYKVIKNVHGKLQTDTVKFIAFDHYGTPAFSDYQYVLLFLGEYCGELYHEKYQFFDVYPTKDGKWARPGDPYAYDKTQVKKVESSTIKFDKTIKFDLTSSPWDRLRTRFVAPYFTISNEIATPIQGAYVDALLEIKKEGVLKARGYQF